MTIIKFEFDDRTQEAKFFVEGYILRTLIMDFKTATQVKKLLETAFDAGHAEGYSKMVTRIERALYEGAYEL